MKVIKLTESDLKSMIERVLREQDTDEEPNENLLIGLRAFSKGRISTDELYSLDDSIDEIRTKNPLGQSVLTIKFDDRDQFAEEIGLKYDDVWFLRSIDLYDGYEFMDSYQIEQDFKEGYNIYGDLNEKNTETLKEIASLILPNKPFEIDDEDYRVELSELLLEVFPSEIDSIITDFSIEKNREMTSVAKEAIKTEFDDVMESIGISLNYDLDELDITVAELYMEASQLNLFSESAKEMVIAIVKNKLNGKDIGGWSENQYEFQDPEKFDSMTFNNDVERQFDNILEKLSEDININSFVDFRNRILSKYKMDVWYDTPKDGEIIFKIDSLDPVDLEVTIHVSRRGGGHKMKGIKLSEEGFNNFLRQESLFDFEDMY